MTQEAPPPVAYPAAPKSCGLATASLICGLLGLVLCGFITGVPAIICGHMAATRIRNSGGTLGGAGAAKWGLITGYVGTILSILLSIGIIIFVIWAVGEAQKNGGRSPF
jgi:hypothetical protein